jgi:hypothetical protein
MVTQKSWFECKVKYEKTSEDGKQKKVTETYLIDAFSFTETESRIIEEVTPFISGEFLIDDIKKVKLSEVFESKDNNADKWYKCKIAIITMDEKSGSEKRKNSMSLVQGTNLTNALKNLDEGMKGSLIDFQIVSVTETNILDVFTYKG